MIAEDAVHTVRAFNRLWTRQAGLLHSGLLAMPYSLAEARVIFEVAQAPSVGLATIRTALGLDAGYATRLVQRLERDGIVDVAVSDDDGRRRVLALTSHGREVFEELDRRANEQAATLLGPLTVDDLDAVLAAMTTMATVFEDTPGHEAFVLRDPQPGDLGWVVQRHGALYASEYGWDERFEALVARIVADFVDDLDPTRERAWIADRRGTPAGSVFCSAKDASTAQLRLLLVEPSARGLGIGARLVTECVGFARRAGYQRMTLWTNDVLTSARRIYEAHGFALTDEHAHHSFGHDLVGQNWVLEFAETT